jgi:lipid II:glycine glycyltransferase (peptidoglycan interpeptide bridge formation enzyme)
VGENKLWSSLKKNRRAGIKRAKKRGISCKVVENEQEMEELYLVLKKTYRHVKIPLADKSLFKAIIEELIPNKMALPHLIKLGEKTIGGRIPLLYEGKIFAWYGSALREFSRFYPNDFSIWELMRWGCRNNYSIFDFGGAGHPDEHYGVRDFKMQFGGNLVNYGRYRKILHPYYYKIADNGFKYWRKWNYWF